MGLSDFKSVDNRVEKDELLRLIDSFNRTQTDYPRDRSIHSLFSEKAALNPDQIAVVFNDNRITYRELEEKSSQLAARLRSSGLETGQPVGILLDKSIETVVAVLGILKAGGAYLPLNNDFPFERTLYIMKDTACRFLITGKLLAGAAERLKHGCPLLSTVICLDDRSLPDPDISQLNDIHITGRDLAYIMYTSGSTGRPKGVLVEHRSVIRLVVNTNYISIGSNDRLTQTGPLSFDASTFEIWGALLNGASLYLVSKEALLSYEKYEELLRQNNITIAWLTASLLNVTVDCDPSIFSGLRVLIAGGDVLSVSHVNRLRKENPALRIINGYGPTENTTFSTFYNIDSVCERAIPIGRPVANSQCYIFDSNNNLLPPGVTGELCVSGDGLARGYLNDDALTASKFIDHPFVPGEKLYRTGDYARWLPDGNIEFSGRIDNQVKIRGFRIELGEIETEIMNTGAVKEVVVIDRKDLSDDKYLCAYAVLNGSLQPEDIRAQIGLRLPDYMVPSHFVSMDRLPLTPNGKIDRKALPDPEEPHTEAAPADMPFTPTEKALCEIWKQILELERVGIHDNFFTLGGHSLKGMRLISFIHKEFGVKMTLRQIFANPTIAAIAPTIDRQKGGSYARIKPAPAAADYPLSHAQKRLWILSRFPDSSVAYNMPGAYILRGEVNEQAFSEAFERLVERHESLRTRFIEVNGEPRQQVMPAEETAFRVRQLSLENTDKQASILNLTAEMAGTPFDLEKGPLLRALLVKLGPGEYLFLFCMHHIISDGWSMGVLISEVSALYRHAVKGEPSSLKPLRIHYKDYSVWQDEQLTGEKLDQHRNYWLSRLEGDIPVLRIPASKPRPGIKTYKGALVRHSLDACFKARIEKYGRDEGATLFMVLLAGLKALFYRYSGQSDIIIGTPTAGRSHADLEDQIGFYVNTLALRTRFQGNDSFEELLRKVKEVTLGGFENQLYPYDKLVEELKLERDLSRSVLFDTMVVLQNTGLPAGPGNGMPGVSIEEYPMQHAVSKFDMTWNFAPADDGLHIQVEYNTDIYEAAFIQSMARHFSSLLDAAMGNPLDPLATLEYFPPEEKRRVLSEFNTTEADYPSDKTVVSLFEEQADRDPDAVALVSGEQRLTYRELNARSNLLAHYLRDTYGAGPGHLIGLMTDRSEKMIIGLLGILKSGAAYMPVDPAYPDQRKEYLIKDSGITLLITEEAFSGSVPASAPATLLIDSAWTDISHSSAVNPEKANSPEDLIYVIYTSGSTGAPKGCELEHRGIVNRIHWMWNHYGFTSQDVILQKTTFVFDVSVWEIFMPLCFGARLVLCTREDAYSPARITALVAREGITTLHFVPGMFKVFLNETGPAEAAMLKSLSRIITSGEALPKETASLHYSRLDAALHNLYGPTEASVDVTYYPVSPKDERIYIGKPISNTRIYILDDNMQPVPPGVYGELFIGGIGLARGYRNQPSLTAEKFIPDPFMPGERLYRTGDIARWSEEGLLEYAGRRDGQVKIRGYRIETGEIESHILGYAGIKEVVVVAREDGSKDKYLAAYIVSDAPVDFASLRRKLGLALPEYMVPAYFIRLSGLPLTASGKTDTRALPDPLLSAEDKGNKRQLPGNETERILHCIWSEVLGRDSIGVDDNFFTVGGHSLKATQIVSRIYRDLQVRIELHEIFLHSTIAELALLINEREKVAYRQISLSGAGDTYKLSHAQKRLWVLSRFEEASVAYNMPGIFVLDNNPDEEALAKAIEKVVERHDILRTIFVTVDDEPRQKVIPPAIFPFRVERIDLRHDPLRREKIRELAAKDATTPFDLEKGPLIKARLIKAEEKELVLLLTLHHIIADGWSYNVLENEIRILYRAFLEGETDPLPPLGIQYNDYAVWQAENDFRKEEEYWLGELRGRWGHMDLPYDVSPENVGAYNKGSVEIKVVPEEITQRLRGLAAARGTTLSNVVFAVYNIFLARITNQKDIVVGTGIANRNHPELENLIGFFVNTLVLVTTVHEDASFQEVLDEVIGKTTRAFEHQNYPYDLLVEKLNPEKGQSSRSLFNVVYAFQNFADVIVGNPAGRDEKDLVLRTDAGDDRWEVPLTTSKFDLTLFVSDYGTNLSFMFEYDTELFFESTIKNFVQIFGRFLEMVAVPEPEQETT